MNEHFQPTVIGRLIILSLIGLFIGQSTADSWQSLFSVDFFQQVAITSPIEAEDSSSTTKEVKDKDAFITTRGLTPMKHSVSTTARIEESSIPNAPDLKGWIWPPDFYTA